MTVSSHQLEFNSQGDAQMQDITAAVHEVVTSTGLANGIVTIF